METTVNGWSTTLNYGEWDNNIPKNRRINNKLIVNHLLGINKMEVKK
jgi:hypothetical protein